MGAMVFGDVKTERIQLNHKHLWSGSVDETDNPKALAAQDEIRKLLFEGKNKQATEIASKTQVCLGVGTNRANAANKPFGCFQTLGDLVIDFDNKKDYTNYRRSLDLESALAKVSYEQGGVTYTRTAFASYPDEVIVVRIQSSEDNSISFSANLSRPERFKTIENKGQLLMSGVMDNGKGGDGMTYWVRMDASHKGGIKSIENGKLRIDNASEVVLYLTAQTDYVGYPRYLDKNYKESTIQCLKKAMSKDYSQLEDTHTRDHSKYFSRVSFNISNLDKDTIPTDIRVSNIKKGVDDLRLQELMFQYGDRKSVV